MSENRFDWEALLMFLEGIVIVVCIIVTFLFFESDRTDQAMAVGALGIVLFLHLMR